MEENIKIPSKEEVSQFLDLNVENVNKVFLYAKADLEGNILVDSEVAKQEKLGPLMKAESSPNLCVNSSFSYVVLSTLLLSSGDLTEWSLVYHNTLSYQRFYDLHSIHYDHLEGLHQLI